MATCAICNKGKTFGNNVSHSKRRTNREIKPNLRNVNIDINGTPKKVKICAKCLKSFKVKV